MNPATYSEPQVRAQNDQLSVPPPARPRVVIVGSGFAGINAARALGSAPADVLLLDRHNYHLFQPLLYQVATAGLEPEEIAYPVRRIVHMLPNVEFRLLAIDRVDIDRRRVVAGGENIVYDYLILAGGSESNFFGMENLARHSAGLKDLSEAVSLRNHVLTCFEQAVALPLAAPERTALLTFVVGGGGPTGVEFAGALAELVKLLVARDYKSIAAHEVRIMLLEGGKDLLSMVHPRLRRSALNELCHKNVEVLLNTEIKDFDGARVTLSTGSHISARTLMWAAGVRASDLGQKSGLTPARQGRLPVTPTLQLTGHPEVYVAGDMAYLEQDGKPLPMLAPVAIQQGHAAAANVLRALRGDPPLPFHYTDRGTLATIGRNSAVAQIGPLRLSGFFAWLTWLLVHLVLLIGFRNRIVVLINWAWSYFAFDRAVRIITSH